MGKGYAFGNQASPMMELGKKMSWSKEFLSGRMKKFMRGNSRMASVMGKDRATMRTATTMKGNGVMEFLMDRVSFSLKTGKVMMGNGRREKPMAKAFIFTHRSSMWREHGKKANSKNDHHD